MWVLGPLPCVLGSVMNAAVTGSSPSRLRSPPSPASPEPFNGVWAVSIGGQVLR